MRSERIRQAISAAAENVLETMFFTTIEGPLADDAPAPAEMVHAALTFSGTWSGSFQLATPLSAAREIAANFTGALDAAEIGDEAVCEVICELSNMVCGSTLSVLDANQLFDLSSPQVNLPGFSARPEVQETASTVAREFALDSGARIVFAIASEAFSLDRREAEAFQVE